MKSVCSDETDRRTGNKDVTKIYSCCVLLTKRPKLDNPRTYVFQVVILFEPSAVHCGFQVLISGIFPFVRKQYKVFSIHFKTSLPVTFTSITC